MSNLDPNAIIRGMQLTLVGGKHTFKFQVYFEAYPCIAVRALQNPGLFKYRHYRQAGIAVLAGFCITILVSVPIFVVKFALYITSFFVDFQRATWDDTVVEGINFVEKNVLQVSFFVMSLMRYITPTLDDV
jgi:hypothetical protein